MTVITIGQLHEVAEDPIGWVNRNNTHFRISLAPEEDISAVAVDDRDLASLPQKGRLSDWHIFKIEYELTTGSGSAMFTAGFLDNGSAQPTSMLQKINMNRTSIQTLNSIYALGTGHEGEPNNDIAMAFVSWLGTILAGTGVRLPLHY